MQCTLTTRAGRRSSTCRQTREGEAITTTYISIKHEWDPDSGYALYIVPATRNCWPCWAKLAYRRDLKYDEGDELHPRRDGCLGVGSRGNRHHVWCGIREGRACSC